jgi:DUF2911 family protein
MKSVLLPLLLIASFGFAQQPPLSPQKSTSVTINGKTVKIDYSAPSMRGRKIFGPDGVISKDGTYPVWRAGANAATALTTDADLMIGRLTVPKGNYTLYVDTGATPWQLIISKQTGQEGSSYDKSQDLGRVPMTVTKPPAPIEQYKITLSSAGGNKGKLQLEWENVVAAVDFTAK